jgi:hypothetical protein
MVILDLSVFERELPSRSLAHEIVAVGMLSSSSIRTGVRHLGVEVAVVTWYAAPSGGSGGTEEVGSLTMSGDVVEPGAIRAAAALLVLILCQGVVLHVLAVPRDGTLRSTPQA